MKSLYEGIEGNSRLDLALITAFEQKADAIFLITDGIPQIRRKLNEAEFEEYTKELAEYE